ncbi:hypothetical protein FQN55_005348 [Onygenales sp. PD_40]|nr:hypothetical protein FQN55_005348 [Onygenales sp. PD_40]KAK2771456.1 hypothetical protein FQN53_004963 [Emmonsiellopsis sp. PD_33]KAK2793941.1 hypothetical protein FQN52_000273 [Onygenales sp. PD_12]KAK2802639.1 hypothetical protein FQN51_004433 [Onygenales sp. PD_10]
MSAAHQVRLSARKNAITFTSGLAPTYLQANLICLPSRYAQDFRLLCQRNPVPCPLLAESKSVGKYTELKSWMANIADSAIAANLDIRTDIPKYMVYKDGKLEKFQCQDLCEEWTEDHVAFLIGCSFSFESALAAAGLPPRQTVMQRNVPMYRTNIPLCAAGVFTGGTYVVSMRPYALDRIEEVRNITRPYVATHGEPIAWGWDAVRQLGIADIDKPEWGDAPLAVDGQRFGLGTEKDVVPVFWGCGVTPQEAVMRANLRGTVMAHAPGHMLVMDVKEGEVLDSK